MIKRLKLPVIILSATLAVMALGGCGIKPGHVEPPIGADKDTFPHVYPAPKDSAVKETTTK